MTSKKTVTDGQEQLDFAEQFATLPWRISDNGETEIMLVTSRISRHWLLPKGWLVRNKSAIQSAQIEAFEEAGVEGKPSPRAVGVYTYNKILKTGESIPCSVTVYALKVKRLLTEWPEASQRERQWFTIPAAADAVFEPQLREMLLRINPKRFR